MGKIKEAQGAKHILTEKEVNYLKMMALSLTYNIAKDKLISGFLYYICTQRFGYAEDIDLQFEIDLEDKARELTVKEVKV